MLGGDVNEAFVLVLDLSIVLHYYPPTNKTPTIISHILSQALNYETRAGAHKGP